MIKNIYCKIEEHLLELTATTLLLIVVQPAQAYPKWADDIARSVCNHYANRIHYEESFQRAYAENYYQHSEWEKYNNYAEIILSAIKARCYYLSEEAYEIYKRQIEFDEYQRKKDERLFISE
jgi:hypothetical protein